MTRPSILIESHNLKLEQGTGIATYARNLASTVSSLGMVPAALYGIDIDLDRRNPLLNEVRLLDANQSSPRRVSQAWRVIRDVMTAPLGVSPTRLDRSGLVVERSVSAAFESTWVAPRLIDRARDYFRVSGACLEVRPAPEQRLLHTTHAVPLLARGVPTVCTIHDIVPLRLPYATLDDKRYFFRLLKKLVERVDHIVTVSEHSRNDILQFFDIDERKITNTYQAVSVPSDFISKSEDQLTEELRHTFNLSYGDYFLYFGAIEPKKNIRRLIEAYARSGSQRPLVIAGGLGWQYERELEQINDDRFLSYRMKDNTISPDRRVRRISYLPYASLVSLIRGARAVLFPSIYEGFGLPVVEAMLLGAPVMTSNVSSLPEIAGDAALKVDPYDIDAMARAISTLDHDGDLRVDLAKRGKTRAGAFSEQAHAERLGAVYRRML